MNRDMLSALSETAGVAAVVVSLLHLSCQVSMSNQLAREVREKIPGEEAMDCGGRGLFELPFYRTSWPILRPFLSRAFVGEFETRYALDPAVKKIY